MICVSGNASLTRSFAFGVPAAVLWASGAIAQATAPLRGTVVGPGGVPVAQATVRFGGRDSTRTSETGQFSFSSARAGTEDLEVRALGYIPKAIRVVVTADSGWSGTIVMDRVPQPLPGVEVVAKPPEFAHTTRYDDFFRRRKQNQGTYRTHEELIARGASDIVSIFQGIPGVYATLTTTQLDEPELRLRITRCPGNPPPIAIYLDGVKIAQRVTTNVELAEVLTSIPILRIQFVEFYRGVGQIPSDLDRGDNCAALVIWTR